MLSRTVELLIGRRETAEPLQCERALEILRHSQTRDVVLRLARLLAREGQLDEAERNLRGYVEEFSELDEGAPASDAALQIADGLEDVDGQRRFQDLATEFSRLSLRESSGSVNTPVAQP